MSRLTVSILFISKRLLAPGVVQHLPLCVCSTVNKQTESAVPFPSITISQFQRRRQADYDNVSAEYCGPTQFI